MDVEYFDKIVYCVPVPPKKPLVLSRAKLSNKNVDEHKMDAKDSKKHHVAGSSIEDYVDPSLDNEDIDDPIKRVLHSLRKGNHSHSQTRAR